MKKKRRLKINKLFRREREETALEAQIRESRERLVQEGLLEGTADGGLKVTAAGEQWATRQFMLAEGEELTKHYRTRFKHS